MLDSKTNTLEDCQNYVCVVGEEMKVKEGLVYNKSNGELIGLCDS